MRSDAIVRGPVLLEIEPEPITFELVASFPLHIAYNADGTSYEAGDSQTFPLAELPTTPLAATPRELFSRTPSPE